MKHLLALLGALLFTSTTFAGLRGYTVVILNVGDAAFFDSPTYKIFRDDEPTRLPEAVNCWNQRSPGEDGVGHKTRIKLPPGMTRELAQAIWNGDQTAFATAQQILRKGDEYSGGGGYDGLYILYPEKDILTLMAIGSRSKAPSKKFTITLDVNDPNKAAAQFDLALCEVSKPLDVGFVP